jgi:MFS family permease
MPGHASALARLNPFTTPEARRLAVLFGVVYFAQGMWYLPNQTITIDLKERGFTAGQVATFFAITTLPWLLKPLYGVLSDGVPLARRRRKSYLVLSSALAALAGFTLAALLAHPYAALASLVTAMGLGLAFTDVLVDALMVEKGRTHGLTGAFQSVQWAATYGASILVGLVGGQLAGSRNLRGAFALAAGFALVSLVMGLLFVSEPTTPPGRPALAEIWAPMRETLARREIWGVIGFIAFWTISPSFGPSLLYYQTDVLGLSQEFIGVLTALGSGAAVIGAVVYAPLSRRFSLRRLIVTSIGLAVAGTLAYLLYRSAASAVVIDVVFGGFGMITQLAFLDLAARACPRNVEATFFALLMSVYNGGEQLSEVVGGYLYGGLGYTPLVLISAAFTALAWLLVPLVRIDEIEARARAEAVAGVGRIAR